MAHITRISAGKSTKTEPKAKKSSAPNTPEKVKKTEKSAKANTKANTKPSVKSTTKTISKSDSKAKKPKKSRKTPRFLIALAMPFKAIGRYVRDSWIEIRQVRWPNRKATWKLVLAVFIYTAIFMVFIMLLDALFTFIFNKVLS